MIWRYDHSMLSPNIAIIELSVLDMKSHIRMTCCPPRLHPPTDFMDRWHLDQEDEVLKTWVLNNSCLCNEFGCLGHGFSSGWPQYPPRLHQTLWTGGILWNQKLSYFFKSGFRNQVLTADPPNITIPHLLGVSKFYGRSNPKWHSNEFKSIGSW